MYLEKLCDLGAARFPALAPITRLPVAGVGYEAWD